MLLGMAWANLMIAHAKRPIFLFLMNAYGYFTPGHRHDVPAGHLLETHHPVAAVTAGVLSIPLVAGPAVRVGRACSFANRTGIVFWVCMGVCVVVSLVTDAEAGRASWSD